MSNLDIYCFTYNCNKQKFNGPVFTEKVADSFPDVPATVYVFAVQEFCSIMDGCFYSTANKIMLSLNELFLQALSTKYGTKDVNFKTVGLEHTGAIGIIAITPFPSKFSNVRTADVGVGYGYSLMKGAVGLRMSVTGADDLTFASAHLPAYEGQYYYMQRNQAAQTIIRALDFGDGYGFLKSNSHAFIMGDLNYRTIKRFDASSPVLQNLLALSEDNESEHMAQYVADYDELTQGRAKGEVFPCFGEGKIGFRPTYKYHLNTAIYKDTRCPSWCDRILYQNTYTSKTTGVISHGKECDILPRVVEYNSIDSLLESDHRPVYLHIQTPKQAPESMVSRHGYLQIVPQDIGLHNHADTIREVLEAFDSFDDTIVGPTQTYIKPTKVDFLIQNCLRRVIDGVLGYILFLLTTRRGRLVNLSILLILWVIWQMW